MSCFSAEIFQGTFSLTCESVSTSPSTRICPCNPTMMGMGETGFTAAEDVSVGMSKNFDALFWIL